MTIMDRYVFFSIALGHCFQTSALRLHFYPPLLNNSKIQVILSQDIFPSITGVAEMTCFVYTCIYRFDFVMPTRRFVLLRSLSPFIPERF